ncbi:hypothetical protein C8Q80DRAFT_1148291 [Daedaleopsis nitida]|nr:hypothetical protein C8Q80DRAFT_1148291 [Daedaleopsis nitida]
MCNGNIYAPLPGSYAVVQIDVEASLQAVNHPKAHEAAKNIKPARCIVYLCNSLQLPFPSIPWCKYKVYLVGRGLRPADSSQCVTSDMSIPIFPCVEHPTGRTPIHPNVPFPFTNCYHWNGFDMERRILIKTRAYTEYAVDNYTELPGNAHFEMDVFLAEDLNRSIRAKKAKRLGQKPDASQPNEEPVSQLDKNPLMLDEAPLNPNAELQHGEYTPGSLYVADRPLDVGPREDSHSIMEVVELKHDVEQNQGADGSQSEVWRCVSCSMFSTLPYLMILPRYLLPSSGSEYKGDWDENDSESGLSRTCSPPPTGVRIRAPSVSLSAIYGMDIFGLLSGKNDYLLPVVDAWLDLGSQVSEEDIPDPQEFVDSYDAIVRCVRNGIRSETRSD